MVVSVVLGVLTIGDALCDSSESIFVHWTFEMWSGRRSGLLCVVLLARCDVNRWFERCWDTRTFKLQPLVVVLALRSFAFRRSVGDNDVTAVERVRGKVVGRASKRPLPVHGWPSHQHQRHAYPTLNDMGTYQPSLDQRH